MLVAFEYERQRRKDVDKKKAELKERQATLEAARMEREVSSAALLGAPWVGGQMKVGARRRKGGKKE